MQVIYRLKVAHDRAEARAQALAVEQSVEMPPGAIRRNSIREEMVGRVAEIRPDGPEHALARIELALSSTGFEAGQLLNMLFGNSSLHPDVELCDLILPDSALERFAGPRHGIAGLHRLAGKAAGTPLTCAALKPLGSSTQELADMAERLALGGIDFIKDDHGLAEQSTAPFAQRVPIIQQAIKRANRVTGGHTCYAPSLTGGPLSQLKQLETARAAGIKALLLAPMISGLGSVQELACDDMALLAHPALAGVTKIAPPLLLGRLFRLAGADAIIYPNYGGRFSFSPERCQAIAKAARQPWHTVAPAMPVPAGGMHPARVEEMLDFYGEDVMLLIGGALLEASDLTAAARNFVERVNSRRQK